MPEKPFVRHVNSRLRVRNLKIQHRYPLNEITEYYFDTGICNRHEWNFRVDSYILSNNSKYCTSGVVQKDDACVHEYLSLDGEQNALDST